MKHRAEWLALVTVLALPGFAVCQQPQTKNAPATEARSILQRFVGRWSTVPPGGTWTIVPVAGGAGVYSDGQMPGNYSAHALWGYDDARGEVFMYEINSIPELLEHRGRFLPDGSVEVVRKAPGTGAVLQRSVLSFPGRDELLLEAWYPGPASERKEELRFVRATSPVGPLGAAADAKPGDSLEDVAQIRAMPQRHVGYTLRREWDRMNQEYAPDVRILMPGQPAILGRDALLKFQEAYPPVTAYEMRIDEVDVRGDLAYARLSYSVRFKAGAGEATDSGRGLWILRKGADGRWRVALDITQSDPPAADAPK